MKKSQTCKAESSPYRIYSNLYSVSGMLMLGIGPYLPKLFGCCFVVPFLLNNLTFLTCHLQSRLVCFCLFVLFLAVQRTDLLAFVKYVMKSLYLIHCHLYYVKGQYRFCHIESNIHKTHICGTSSVFL